MTIPTEEELRSMCRAGGGELFMYTHMEANNWGPWICNIRMAVHSPNYMGSGSTREQALENAWEEYAENNRDKSAG